MLRTLPIVLLLASAAAAAEVYRWVDAEGRVSFSDRPQPGAETLGQPAKPEAPKKGTPAKPAGSPDAPLLGPYTGFEIASPEANETLRQDQGKLPLSLIVNPPLMSGHRLELAVDGAPVAVDSGATQLALTGVTYGSHRVQALIRNAEGAIVARTAPVSFHLRKPIPPGVLQ